MLQVWVLEGKELHKQDIGGKADPFVQLQTRVQDLEKTVCLTTSLYHASCDACTLTAHAHALSEDFTG